MQGVQGEIEALYRRESRRVFATLIRLLGDFQHAEEALQEAFVAALRQWPEEGIPSNPRAWLVSTGRFKAIDKLRREARFATGLDDLADRLEADTPDPADWADADLDDDRLRLIFTCCHPALAQEAQVALTLREVCDLTTEEIARAFLTSTPTMAQRIVRAKSKIRDANIPYEVPVGSELAQRLNGVLQVIYLLYNEGYSASAGDGLTRGDIAVEALRLGELVAAQQPTAESLGLLALMLLQEARRAARSDSAGELVLLPEQDRSLWDAAMIRRGCRLVERALQAGDIGPYALQGAIAAVHAEAACAEQTDWPQIVGLYTALMSISPSPVVALNRAVALGMQDGAEVGLAAVDDIVARGELKDYHLSYAARADFLRRLQRPAEAREAYRRALALVRQEPERRFLEKRLAELDAPVP